MTIELPVLLILYWISIGLILGAFLTSLYWHEARRRDFWPAFWLTFASLILWPLALVVLALFLIVALAFTLMLLCFGLIRSIINLPVRMIHGFQPRTKPGPNPDPQPST